MTRAMALKWVESEGGPLVLIERAAARGWSGYRGDYDKTYVVEEATGVITINSAGSMIEVLVIGDEPLRTTWLSEYSMVVQWIYASSEDALIDGLLGIDPASIDWDEGPTISIGGDALMFDAALPWEEAGVGDALSIALRPGCYRVLTADINLDSKNAARLHFLEAIENS